MDSAPEAGTSTPSVSSPHEMRITHHGKIRTFVCFALKFLQENPQRPLVFHTFPVKPLNPRALEQPPAPSDASIEADHAEQPPKKRRKLATSTATIPRLVTVVEIVKREYGKWAATRSQDGKPVKDSMRTGLHQYNELGCLEDLGIVPPQEQTLDEAEQLFLALEGKNFVKQKQTAHLKVTLSVDPQPELEKNGATHQAPPPVKKTRSAKARERKKMKKNSMQ